MSDIFTNLLGGNQPQQVNIPPFTSPGGITGPEQAYVDYSLGQDLAGVANEFGTSGTGHSTMATQGAEGAHLKAARLAGEISDTNQSAEYQAYQNQVTNLEQNLQNQSTLDQLAQQNQNQQDFVSGFTQQGGFTSPTSITTTSQFPDVSPSGNPSNTAYSP